MVSVVYEAPDTVEGAVSILADSSIPAFVLAGGTDLVIQTRASKDAERLVVDIKKNQTGENQVWAHLNLLWFAFA